MEQNKKEDRWALLFDMHEHPERYTDEQIEELLADDEMRQMYNEMATVRMALQRSRPEPTDTDQAWREFVARQGERAGLHRRRATMRWKIAASIVGVIGLSGFAWAAIHQGWFAPKTDTSAPVAMEQKAPIAAADSMKTVTAEPKDTVSTKPTVFDNAELQEVLTQFASYYHVKVEYANEASRHIRIYFNWDRQKTLTQNIEILNAFERIQIREEDGTLKVE